MYEELEVITQGTSQGSTHSLYAISPLLIHDRLTKALFIPVRAANPEQDKITRVFFPLRWIPFESSP